MSDSSSYFRFYIYIDFIYICRSHFPYIGTGLTSKVDLIAQSFVNEGRS